jgi:hypothetical protein
MERFEHGQEPARCGLSGSPSFDHDGPNRDRLDEGADRQGGLPLVVGRYRGVCRCSGRQVSLVDISSTTDLIRLYRSVIEHSYHGSIEGGGLNRAMHHQRLMGGQYAGETLWQ